MATIRITMLCRTSGAIVCAELGVVFDESYLERNSSPAAANQSAFSRLLQILAPNLFDGVAVVDSCPIVGRPTTSDVGIDVPSA